MAEIETSVLRIGSNDLILQDAQARQDISNIASQVEVSFATDTASGAIASFPDGADNVPVKSLTVDIEPVQDLHGQANPYPAGGGKNLLMNNGTSQTVSGITFTKNTDGSVVVNGTSTGNIFYLIADLTLPAGTYILNGCPVGGSNAGYSLRITEPTSHLDVGNGVQFTLSSETTVKVRIVFGGNGGVTANNLVFKPTIRLSSVSDSTFAPYSNICPISGHTQATVVRVGKNLLKNNGQNQTINGITFTKNSDGSISVNGTSTGNVFYFIADIVLPSGTYILNGCPNGGGNSAYSLRITEPTVHADFGSGTQFTLSEETTVKVRIVFGGGGGVTANNLIFKPMIRLSSVTDATYAPYNGQTVTISLNGTRYGGTLNVETGVLTVDRVAYTFTNGTGLVEGTDGNADWLCVRYNASDVSWDTTDKRTQNICSYAPFTFANVNGKTHFYTTANVFQLFVPKGVYPSLSAFTSSLSTKPLTFTVFLSTPQTVQLTANEISTVLGQNNIWNDCGDTTVEYRADTALYIKKLTGSTEDDMVADANIVSGQYFMVGNTLYKATANIASGGAITPNVNCTRKSLPEALNEINA